MAEQIVASADVTGLFDDEALLRRRIELHHELGRISNRICEVNQEYSACIDSILRADAELNSRGIDRSHLRAELWPALPEENADIA